MQATFKQSYVWKSEWLKLLTIFLLAAPMLLIFLGCQLTPQLANTTDFNEETGKLQAHQLNKEPKKKTKAFGGGSEMNDMILLDQLEHL